MDLLAVANTFWANQPPKSYSLASLEPYSQYYTDQCKTAYYSLATKLYFSKHTDILQVARLIKQGLTRDQVAQEVESLFPNIPLDTHVSPDNVIEGVINLTTRLLLMTDVGEPARNRAWTGRAYRVWDQGNIHDFTRNIFTIQRTDRHDGIQLDIDFNARNLDVIGGFKVELTNNLLDHLEVVDIEGETRVMIFHHISFLKNQEYPLFPDRFIYETLQTLSLLFPQNKWYKETKVWYRKNFELSIPDADPAVLNCGPLELTNIDGYHYWHNRLVRLKQLFDQAKPRTLRQWWNDRREGTQWYALWVAVGFTVFFGFIQSIEGAMQVYKAFHPD